MGGDISAEPNPGHPHRASWYLFSLLFGEHLSKNPKEGDIREPLYKLKKWNPIPQRMAASGVIRGTALVALW